MASIRKRGGMIYVDYRYNGQRVQKSTGLQVNEENMAYAENKLLPALEYQIENGLLETKNAPRKKRSVNDYAEVYFASKVDIRDYTLYAYKKRYERNIEPVIGDMDISSVRKSDIRELVTNLAGGKSKNTIAAYMCIIRGIFEMALEDEIIDRSPADGVRVKSSAKTKEIEPYSDEEAAVILGTASGQLRNFIGFAFFTGMRIGELLGLKWEDVDTNSGHIAVRRDAVRGKIRDLKTKSSRRLVPIFDELEPFIRDQFKITGLKNEWIFPSRNGEPYFDASVISKKQWKPLLRACGIHHRRLYNTRHTFAIYMLKNIGKVNGVTLDTIAQILGHTNTSMLIKNYAKFIKNEHLKIDRRISLFGDTVVTPDNIRTNKLA